MPTIKPSGCGASETMTAGSASSRDMTRLAGVVPSEVDRVCLDLDRNLILRLDRLAKFIGASGLANLSREDLIVDAIERYLGAAEMAAPGIAGVPLDTEPPSC